MAGIISNVTGDIQRLRDLKTAIEDVKKSLISINIKVNVDMKESLEAKLKSLTDQYVELGTKVALTEARINQSAQNIIKAAQKITEAQDNMSKASINVAPTSGSSVSTPNTQALSAEKVEIAAQAKAYNELKEQIGDIIGARGQNIKRMIEEQNAIRLINAEIKQITKSQGEYSNVSTSQQKRLEQLNNSLLTHKTVLAEVRQNLSNNVKLDNAAVTSMNELSQSLSRMRIAYRELTEEERKSPFGKELLTSINRADAEIKGLDATIGNHARNVGNYKAKWDGLGMSIQQIGRELPSLAYGPKVFFSAISNNLPILTDEIKRAKAEFKALKAEGKDATPVWKQVATSLFSWNTALTVGITLLTLYGDKIVDWVAGLFDAKDALSEVTSYQQNLSKVMSDGAKSSAQERVELDVLYKATQNHTKSLKDRNAAADELQRKYPSYFGNLSNEAILAGDVASAYKNLTDNILMAAQARSAMKIIEENYNKIYQTQKAINADTNWVNRNREKTKGGTATETASSVMNSSAGAVTQTVTGLTQDAAEYNRRTEALKKNKEAVDLLEKSNEALAESIDIAALTDDTTGKYDKQQESAAEKLRKEQEKLALLTNKQALDQSRSEQDLQNQVAQVKIDSMQEGSDKTIAQMQLNHTKEIETLKRNREDYLQKKIEAEKALFESDPSNKGQSFDSSTVSLSKEEQAMFKSMLASTIDKQGNEIATYYKDLLSKYQGYAEKRLAAQKKFQQERDALVKAGASKEALDEHDYQRDETFESIDNEFAMRENSFKAWADNIADLSLEKLRVLLVQAERELERSEFLNPKDPKLAGQRAKVTSLKNTISEKSEKTNTSPDKRSQKEWQDLYKTLSKVENEFEEIGKTVGGTAGEIISAAGVITASTLKMIDGIVSLSDSSAWAISSTATAAQKAIKAVEKASVILAIIGAAMKVVSEISQMIAGESQEEKMKRTVDYYNKIVDIYDQIIDKQKESIKFGYGFASIEAATKAMDDLNKKTEYNRKIAEVSGKSGISAKDYFKDYTKLAKELGLSMDVAVFMGPDAGIDTSELSRLTGEQLEYIRDNYKELWAGLRDEQKDALQAIIDAEKEGQEIIDKWNESITGISYESFYSEFIDTLSDMDSSAEDMAENFGEYLKKSILAAMVAKEFKGKIDELYQMWVTVGEKKSDGGTDITEDEAKIIQQKQKELTEAMIKRREEMAKTYGWESTESSSQDSTKGGFQSMSQDTGNELNGRFTALQIAGEEIKNQNILQSQSLNILTMKSDAILTVNTEIKNIADETRTILANSYLELQDIRENTGAIVKPIIQMQKDMEEVKKNTSKL